MDGLCDYPRPGVPRKITDADVERVIVKTLEETPKNATHWSTRSMAAATGMSESTVSRIWRTAAQVPQTGLNIGPWYATKEHRHEAPVNKITACFRGKHYNWTTTAPRG